MERNITLDYFKIALSICVIIAHNPFVSIYPPEGNDLWNQFLYILGWETTYSLGRIAVPAFFIINGFFLNLDDRAKVIKYVTKLIKLYIVWAIFYLPCYYPYLDIKSFFIIFATGYYHLWYFPALIGAVIMLFFIHKIIKNKYALLIIAFTLFCIGYWIQDKNPYDNFELLKYRNFIFFGIPMVTIGYVLRQFDLQRIKKILPYIIVLFAIILFTEVYIYMEQQRVNNLYFSFFLICPALFIYFLINGKMGKDTSNGVIPLLSSAVFYIHPIIIRWTALLFDIDVITFPYVVITTFIIAYLIIQVNKTIKIFL
ncbi:acyltransferase family protein [Dysgonomonas macrotermitis]|uniref:Surface polysaccharide O-acyltransferase, integral membrane enzyme n=1 Tax=Dysgonomonas macrotermitis TaxID=1346286 RepID=A0A1M5DZ71_9BACT|nr:acyltransferase [Dysgonomonas macrotermitis]SHF72273.1 Surface polysaccharide O-acyltransferase, integral membrane enzyme [Dysgonomonas macrotermitis]